MAAPVISVTPLLSGTYEQGQKIYCSSGTWTGLGTSYTYSYQWQRAGVDISGATLSNYTLAALDVGVLIRCRVRATNVDGFTDANSNAVTPTIASDLLVRVGGAWRGTNWQVRDGSTWV
jgi:hypothetical protein